MVDSTEVMNSVQQVVICEGSLTAPSKHAKVLVSAAPTAADASEPSNGLMEESFSLKATHMDSILANTERSEDSEEAAPNNELRPNFLSTDTGFADFCACQLSNSWT